MAVRKNDNFYVVISLVVIAIVVAGFGPTADARLFHPPTPRPLILSVHAVVFSAWILLFAAQAALIRVHRVAVHRRLGVTGIVIGTLVPFIGIATALTMTRFRRSETGGDGGEAFLIISIFDMLAFAVTFALAMFWRRRSEVHRRLLLIATCGLTVAAFARLPGWLVPDGMWYVGVDLLICAGAARDWLVTRRVHEVYVIGLPLLVAGQLTTMWIYRSDWPAWLAVASWLLG